MDVGGTSEVEKTRVGRGDDQGGGEVGDLEWEGDVSFLFVVLWEEKGAASGEYVQPPLSGQWRGTRWE